MGRKTYTYRTSSFVMGVLILLFLFLLSLSFLAGYYLGSNSRAPSPSEREGKTVEKIPVREEEVKPPTPVKKEPIKPEKGAPQPGTLVEEKKPPEGPARGRGEGGGHYLLQVAALKRGESARRLSQELSSRGYPSKVELKNGFYRVLVGPFDLSRARDVRKELLPLLRKLRVRLRSEREILIRRAQ